MRAGPVWSLLVLASLGAPAALSGEAELLEERRIQMGTTVQIKLLARDEAAGRSSLAAAFAEIDRVEALMSTYQPDSELQRLNRSAGLRPAPVGPDLQRVLQAARAAWEFSEGAFDATYPPLWRLWKKNLPDRAPTEPEIRQALSLVGWQNFRWEHGEKTAYLTRPGMAVNLGGIAKGYAVDRALETLRSRGIMHALVNAGGDLRGIGSNRGAPWKVGLQHPRQPGELLATLPVRDEAVVTSGDYERYIEIDGERYAHILDPRTGRPARELISVTVIGPTAMEADALATAVFVLGARDGLALVNRRSGFEAVVVAPDGTLRMSEGMEPGS